MQAKELGVRTVIIDGPDSWAQSLKTDATIEKFVGLDFSDADTVFERCMEAINKVKKVGSLAHWALYTIGIASKGYSNCCS